MSLLTTPYSVGGEVLSEFMKSEQFVRAIRGPIGSGTSTACCVELFRRAAEQKQGPDGLRHSRSSIIRLTNTMLETTTIQTWLQWFPEQDFGKFRWSKPYLHRIRYNDIHWDVYFMPCATEDDINRLLSLELTSAWINEARDVPKEIVDALTGRLRRYPSKAEGGPTWTGLIMDTNAMPHDHWWPIMSGEAPVPEWMHEEDALLLVKPHNWAFYTQPEGMKDVVTSGRLSGYEPNDGAENIDNLNGGFDYYDQLMQGKKRDWIQIYVQNKLGIEMSGRAVYDNFDENVHAPAGGILPEPDVPLVVGIDFGLTPAAVIGQRVNGRWLILSELIMVSMGAKRFAERLRLHLSDHFPMWWNRRDTHIRFWADPAGEQRSQTDENTPLLMMRTEGLPVRPAPTNDFALRKGAVENVMGGLVDGKPRFLMDRYRCSVLFAACKGGYQYRRLQTKEEKYGTEPDKNRYSHPADALQYLLVGEGETKELRVPDGFNRARQPQTGNRDGNPISRRRARTQSRSQRRIRAIHDRLP
jgi:hypothetical protein